MTPWVAFTAGAIVTGVVCFIIMGRMVTVWYDRKKEADRFIFRLNEHIKHLEAQKSPTYQVGVGVDNVARRNELHIPDLRPAGTEPWDEDGMPAGVLTVEEQDVWDSSIGGYRRVD